MRDSLSGFTKEKSTPSKPAFPRSRDIRNIVFFLRNQFFPLHFPLRFGGTRFKLTLVRLLSQGFALEDNCYACRWRKYKKKAYLAAQKIIKELPQIKELLMQDVKAAFESDPSAYSHDEIILSYPSITALVVYRVSHILWNTGIPLIPRMLSEYAHSLTGIDIHPGASIGYSMFIDHGTGVVIGETAEVGNSVRIYQGVTIGALSVPSRNMKGRRHPIIEDRVIIYAEATILGGETRVGHDSIVGGNMWITSSIPPHSRVYFRGDGVEVLKASKKNVAF